VGEAAQGERLKGRRVAERHHRGNDCSKKFFIARGGCQRRGFENEVYARMFAGLGTLTRSHTSREIALRFEARRRSPGKKEKGNDDENEAKSSRTEAKRANLLSKTIKRKKSFCGSNMWGGKEKSKKDSGKKSHPHVADIGRPTKRVTSGKNLGGGRGGARLKLKRNILRKLGPWVKCTQSSK